MRLEIRDLHRSFGTRPVLRGIDLDHDAGSLAIIGPSGGGKSTLLRVLAGLIAPDRGEVRFDGEPVDFREPVVRRHRKRIGFVFQSHGLFDHLTGLDNITLPLIHVHGLSRSDAEARGMELLAHFRLADQAGKVPSRMSGGQQQRIAIARAVATNPDWLLLDEPTSALDPEYTAEVLDMLSDLGRDGRHIILVTHHMGFARHACERVAFLADGRLLEVGPAEDVFSRPRDPELQRFLAKILEWDT